MPEKYSKNIAHKLTHYNTLIINKNILLTKPESWTGKTFVDQF